MNFQISPKIIIGEFSKHLLFEKEYSNILVLTSKSIESIHKISKQVKSISGSKIKVISDVVPELPFTYVKMLYDRMDIYPDLMILQLVVMTKIYYGWLGYLNLQIMPMLMDIRFINH